MDIYKNIHTKDKGKKIDIKKDSSKNKMLNTKRKDKKDENDNTFGNLVNDKSIEDDENTEENLEDSLDLDDFEEFNKELDELDEEYNEENYEDEENNSIEDEDGNIDFDESIEDKNEKIIKYDDMYDRSIEKRKKTSKIKLDIDNEIENSIFIREHSNPENLDKRIEDLENKAVSAKDWKLRGEINAKSRPINSLLNENFDYKSTSRPKPKPSTELNAMIEKMIKLRISSDLFDDPKFVKVSNKKKNEDLMDFNKSKKSLGELYEEDFLGKEKEDEPLTQDKIEIEDMMDDLFRDFNDLTNNTFVTERLKNEMNVIKNVKAIKLEDISKFVPLNKPNKLGSIINPDNQELKINQILDDYNPKKGEYVTKEELDSEEKKLKRKQMKRKVHKKINERNLNRKINQLSKDYDSKFEVNLAMKKIKDKEINKEITNKELKSSSFFKGLNKTAKEVMETKKEKIKYQKENLSGYSDLRLNEVKNYKY